MCILSILMLNGFRLIIERIGKQLNGENSMMHWKTNKAKYGGF